MIRIKNYIGTSINANLFRGIEAVGGKIHFDDNSLIFESHKLNMQKGKTEIKYKDIGSISKRNTLGIVPNGIKIVLKNGIEYGFVVNNRKKIIEFLNLQK